MDIEKMDMPCKCDCGRWFDHSDGWGCYSCSKLFCPDCMDDGDSEKCPSCKGDDE